MTTELARIDDQAVAATAEPFAQAPLAVQMDYARAVSTAALLPQAYRNKPADIMLAVGLGSSMGLSPAESLYRIDVIQGKPTASAELIAANVRKAGHRLRITGDDQSSTATIIRADDPDFEFTVTRDRAWAQAMGLASKDNYKKQPGTMLQWRAITAVARLACPEALYGVAYTSDEMYDVGDRPARPSGLGAALGATTAEQVHDPSDAEDAHDVGASAGESDTTPPAEQPAPSASESPLLNTRSNLAKRMYAAITEAGIPEDGRIPFLANCIGRDITSSKEMTDADAHLVLDVLVKLAEDQEPDQ